MEDSWGKGDWPTSGRGELSTIRSTQQSQQSDLTELLTGQDCKYCTNGTLRKGTYKGTDAVVCDYCDVPTAQVWSL